MKPYDIRKELKDLDSILVDIQPEQKYSLPDNYFEELTGKVLRRVRKEQKRKGTLHLLINKYAGLAASLIVLIGLMLWYANHYSHFDSNLIEHISKEDVTNYFIDNPEELYLQEFLDIEIDADFSLVNLESLENLDESNIDHFLIDNMDDLDDILIDEFK